MPWPYRRLGTLTITVSRPGPPVETAYGSSAGPATTHTIDGCSVQPLKGIRGASNETFTATSDFIETRYWLFAPVGADLLATDAVRVPGISALLQVSGDPGPEVDINSTPDHVEAYLSKWEGGH